MIRWVCLMGCASNITSFLERMQPTFGFLRYLVFRHQKNAFLTTMGSLITRPLNGGLPIYGLRPLKMSKQRSYGDGSKPIFTIGGSTSNQLFCCVPSGYQGFDHQFCCCNGVPQFQSNPSGSPHDM